jgi:beta-phosphoglucomutase
MNEQHVMDDDFCFEAVIFDMDGTVIDSINSDFLAWQKLFGDYGKTLSFDDYIPLLGIRSFYVASKFLPLKNEEDLNDALAKKLVYFREVVEENGINSIPHVDEFIKKLKEHKIPLALATSSRRAKMKMVMEEVGLLSFFDVIVAGEDVTNGKPSPEIFLKAASMLNVAPGNCVVFEDAANGVKAAKKASMKCVAIASEITKGLLDEADVIIESFENLEVENLCSLLRKIPA